jgi:hypothetical protein
MSPNEGIPIIQHAIQLAVAPVFLLSGVAGLLAVMAGRLARIIDRARDIEQKWAMLDEKARGRGKEEISILEHRRSFGKLVDQLLRQRSFPGVHRHRHTLFRRVPWGEPQMVRRRSIRCWQ